MDKRLGGPLHPCPQATLRRLECGTLKSCAPAAAPLRADERPSLLWPGQARERLLHWEWAPLAFAYLLAVLVRWSILDAQPYTAEAAHYAMSLHLWDGVDNVGSLFLDIEPDDFSWFFWQRPLLCLLYWPAAQFGFEAYRAAHILVAGTVPVLAAVLLRHLGTHPALAHGSALVLCVHPVLVPWGTLVLPDTTVAAFTLAGLIAAHDGRPWATAGLLLAGSWVKEVGFVTALSLAVLAAWRGADGRRSSLRPLHVDRFAVLLFAVAALSFLPLFVSLYVFPGAMPGFRIGGDMQATLERLFLLLWLAPLPVIGLLLPRVRRLALVALAWPAFFIVYHVATGKAIEVWYNVVPATLILVAAAATLSHQPRAGGPVQRWTPAVASVLFAGLLMVQVAVPQGTAWNAAVATPLDRTGQWDLRQALEYEHVRDDDFAAALDSIPDDPSATWLALNLDYSLVMHPMAGRARHVFKDFTVEWDAPDESMHWWADAVENRSQATILAASDDSTNHALREAYARCAATFGQYTVILPDPCRGSQDALVEAYHRWRDARFPDPGAPDDAAAGATSDDAQPGA